jgi:hypothetical protein
LDEVVYPDGIAELVERRSWRWTSMRPNDLEPSASYLIDLEEDKAARAVVFGLLAEMERK